MQELRSEEMGNRKVALVEDSQGRFEVTIAVYGPAGEWIDISLYADQGLEFTTASRRYRERIAEQRRPLSDG